MDYIQNTPEDTREMLSAIGAASVEDLFRAIPEPLRLKKPLDLPPAMTEYEILKHMHDLGRGNRTADTTLSFLGGGVYDHFVPSVVEELSRRNEFYTAYTPYQAEASQGTLQATFEYQSMVCSLMGMDVSNASHYDGATALVEAVAMALDHTGREHVVISRAVNPDYRKVLASYLQNVGTKITELPAPDGTTDFSSLKSMALDDAACVVIQNPNYFGVIEDLEPVSAMAHDHGALMVASADPISMGLLKSPGDCGADIATGEGQAMGLDPAYGGPYVGLMAAKMAFVRRMPGRIVGETVDTDGKRAFVLTLQTREQHIRREKASSNICTNQALLALRASIYMASMGKQGIRDVALGCLHNSHYLAEALTRIPGVTMKFPAPFFQEFVIQLPRSARDVVQALLKEDIFGGLEIEAHYPELKDCLLVCATEKHRRSDLDRYAESLKKILS